MPWAGVHWVGGHFSGMHLPSRTTKPTAGRSHGRAAAHVTSRCGCGGRSDVRDLSRLPAGRRHPHKTPVQRLVPCYALPVEDMKVIELKEELKERGLPMSGNKAALQDRLSAARQSTNHQTDPVRSSIEQDPVREAAAASDADISTWSDAAQQAEQQQEEGGQLAQRNQQQLEEEQQLAQKQQQMQQLARQPQQMESMQVPDFAQQAAKEEDWGDLSVARLRTQLRVRGLGTWGTKDKLVERITESAGPEVEELSELGMVDPSTSEEESRQNPTQLAESSPTEPVASPSDINDLSSYKASELKAELARLGLPSTGSRLALETRLMEYYQTNDDPYEQLAQKVEGMSSAELQEGLLARGANIQGLTKIELQDMLWAALQAEAGLLEPQPQEGLTEDQPEEQLQFSTPAATLDATPRIEDPPLMVALLCGGPLGGQTQSLTSAQMLLQQLQTHNPREGFHGGTAAAPSASALDSSSNGNQHQHSLLPASRRSDLSGIHFVPVFVSADLQAMPITSADLCGKNAATLQFEASSGSREVLSLEQLGNKLRSVADLAVSTVPGTASGAGQVQSALQAAGLPYLGASSQVHHITSHNLRCQGELQKLGFPILPMLELRQSDFATPSDSGNVPVDHESASGGTPEASNESDDASSPVTNVSSSTNAEPVPEWQTVLEDWMSQHGFHMDKDSFVVKPADASQSQQTWLVNSLEMLEQRARQIFAEGLSQSVVVEEYCSTEECTEFAVTVLGTAKGPVALLPTEASSYDIWDDIGQADMDLEAYQARQEGYDQKVIELIQSVQAQRELVSTLDFLDQPLINPFQPDQPSHRQLRLHTPARFSKEIVEGIRHAAGRIFRDLGLQDIACIKGWVKTAAPEVSVALSSPPPMRAVLNAAPDTSDSALDAEPDVPELPPVESLPDNYNNFHISPRAVLAIPSLGQDSAPSSADISSDGAAGGWFSQSGEEQEEEDGSIPSNDEAQSTVRESESDDEALLAMRDSESDDEDLLTALFYSEPPEQLCRHGSQTIYFSGIDAAPSLHPTSVVFQQAADVGMSHSALLRQVLSATCQRAHLPAIPCIPPQDIITTALVPYAQVRGAVHEGDVDLGGAALSQAPAVYAPPDHLLGPTPSGRIETMAMPVEQRPQSRPDNPWEQPASSQGGQFGQQWDEQQYGSAQPSYQYSNDAYAQDYNAAPAYQQPATDEPAGPSKVWVLMGGEGHQRQNSLKSGLHVWLMLQNHPELQVEPFLLAPLGSSIRERDRRKDLLKQRNAQLLLGLEPDQLDKPLQLQNIRDPDPPQHELPGRAVWAVPHALLVRDTVEDVHEACELALGAVNVVGRTLTDAERSAPQLRHDTQQMLQYAEVGGAGSLWGYVDSLMTQPPPPRFMDLQTFAEEARSEGAVVLNVVQAEVGDNGQLQSFLEDADVQTTHTGSDALATTLCHDKIAMSDHLKPLEMRHISTIPKRHVSRDQLSSVAEDEQAADALFQDLRSSFGDTPEVCVKPAKGGLLPNQPLPCLANGSDLLLYSLALQERMHFLPEDYLSTPHPPIPLPPGPTQDFMVEPYIHAARLVQHGRQGGVAWEGESRWIAISAALLGEVGRMQVLTPSILIHPAPDAPSQEQAVLMTPPPADFLPTEVIDSAKHWMTLAADRLAIAGAAQMDVLVHADKGEIIIVDVHTVPDLSQDSLLLQQALVEEPPVHPADVLREIVDLGQLPLQAASAAQDPQGDPSNPDFDEQDELSPEELDDMEQLSPESRGLLEERERLESAQGQDGWQSFSSGAQFQSEQGDEQGISAGAQFESEQGQVRESDRGRVQGNQGNDLGWSDDSFTDAALDDNDFEAETDVQYK